MGKCSSIMSLLVKRQRCQTVQRTLKLAQWESATNKLLCLVVKWWHNNLVWKDHPIEYIGWHSFLWNTMISLEQVIRTSDNRINWQFPKEILNYQSSPALITNNKIYSWVSGMKYGSLLQNAGQSQRWPRFPTITNPRPTLIGKSSVFTQDGLTMALGYAF